MVHPLRRRQLAHQAAKEEEATKSESLLSKAKKAVTKATKKSK